MKKIKLTTTLCILMLFGLSMTVSAHEHEGHDYYKLFSFASFVDVNYHEYLCYCNTCKKEFILMEPHNAFTWYFKIPDYESEYMGDAYGCEACNYVEFCEESDWSNVYKNYSTKFTIKLYGQVYAGDKLIVKIGPKTYKKNFKTACNSPKLKIKINKPKKNYEMDVWIIHAGKKLNLGCADVLTSKNPRIGMTKKEVFNYTSWPTPDKTKTTSGGYTYWKWKNGSYVVFKNGKVKKWKLASNRW